MSSKKLPLPTNKKGPVYTLTIPSSTLEGKTERKIKYRPFFVKDEAALLTVKESNDIDAITETLKETLKECIIDDIDLDALPYFDISYIFTQVRAKSVGEIAAFKVKCLHCTEEGNYAKVDIDLTKLSLTVPENHKTKVDLGNGLFVSMRYMPLSEFSSINLSSNVKSFESGLKMIVSSIESIYTTEEEYYDAKDYTEQEMMNFVQSLTRKQLETIKEEFFDSSPRLQQVIEYDCPKCGEHNKKTLGNLINFFL